MNKLLRPFTRNLGFTITAVVVLALGIGANTAIFTAVRAVLLKPLPYNDPDRIVVVAETNKRGVRISVSGADFTDWKAQATSFDAIASYGNYSVPVVAGGSPERLNAAAVNTGWFTAMGAKPVLGRLFDPAEEKPNSEKTALISDGLWRRRFGADPKVLGAKLKLQGAMHIIVGVLPAGFRFPGKTDLWVPLGLFPDSSTRSAHNYRVISRLKSSVSAEQAQAEMTAIAARLAKQYPESNQDIGAAVVPLHTTLSENAKPTLYLLLAAVGFVLLIACANVGNLLLASGARRRTEFAIRAAIGASRTRLVRQLLGESITLAALGGVLGIALAWWSKDLIIALAPSEIPMLSESRIDWAAFAFGVAVSMATGVLFGLFPALQMSRTDLNDALKSSGNRAGVGGAGTRMRSVLVCVEIALSVVLVTGAGLAIRSLVELQNVSPGYDSLNVMVADMAVPAENDAGMRRSIRIYEEFLRRAESTPGVLAAGAVSTVPLSELGSSNGYFSREGQKQMDRSQSAGFHTASERLFPRSRYSAALRPNVH